MVRGQPEPRRSSRERERLARGQRDLLGDPARARAMGRAARTRLESEFTLERSVASAERTIEETAGRLPAAARMARE